MKLTEWKVNSSTSVNCWLWLSWKKEKRTADMTHFQLCNIALCQIWQGQDVRGLYCYPHVRSEYLFFIFVTRRNQRWQTSMAGVQKSWLNFYVTWCHSKYRVVDLKGKRFGRTTYIRSFNVITLISYGGCCWACDIYTRHITFWWGRLIILQNRKNTKFLSRLKKGGCVLYVQFSFYNHRGYSYSVQNDWNEMCPYLRHICAIVFW